jgi:hypothetical protein
MARFIIGVFAAVLLTAVGAGPSAASPGDALDTRIPPQLTGFAPADVGAVACERYVNKRATLFPLMCVMKCSVNFASATSKGLTYDANQCENDPSYGCKTQYDRAMGKINGGLCPACLDQAARGAVYEPTFHDVAKSFKDLIYCDSTNAVAFSDGHGYASNNVGIAKCQIKVARDVNKAIKCLKLKCHQKVAEALFWGKAARLADCEAACKEHFIASTADLSGCPSSCLGVPARTTTLFDAVKLALDTENGDVYCH